MKTIQTYSIVIMAAVLAGSLPTVQAQSFNVWRGGEISDTWDNPYKWNLKHTPLETEAVHFRENTSTVDINKTITLNNGMLLFGQELIFGGSGNINLANPVPHQRTVNIPASASGFANLTLNDTLSLNGRIALAAKAFGTAESKGTITLKNRTEVTGPLCIGNDGCGTGKVFVRDNATYNITGLELTTRSGSGGSAEIHILGGMVRVETKANPFMPFFEDDSRKIVLGEGGSLRFDTNLSLDQKVQQIKAMIQHHRLTPAQGCRLKPPVIDSHSILVTAEDLRTESSIDSMEKLMAAIDRNFAALKAAELLAKQKQAEEAQARLEMQLAQQAEQEAAQNQALGSNERLADLSDEAQESDTKAVAGYVVFLGSILLMVRRPKQQD